MAAIPTIEEEDAKRANRERENLVCERSRIINRMKACLIRFGVRAFKPTLRKAPDRLVKLRTPEGVPLPPNTIAEMRRDMARGKKRRRGSFRQMAVQRRYYGREHTNTNGLPPGGDRDLRGALAIAGVPGQSRSLQQLKHLRKARMTTDRIEV